MKEMCRASQNSSHGAGALTDIYEVIETLGDVEETSGLWCIWGRPWIWIRDLVSFL